MIGIILLKYRLPCDKSIESLVVMEKKLCYVSNNETMNASVEKIILENGYSIKLILPSEFMVEIWTNKPDFIIVDVDSIGEKGVTIVDYVLEDEYVSTVYIYAQYSDKWENMTSNGILISEARCETVIKEILMNSLITGHHYNQISVNYETMRLISEEFDTYLNTYMKAQKSNEPAIVDKFLSAVYSENYMMHQIPKWFVVINQKEKFSEAWSFGKGLDVVSYVKEENSNIKAYIEKAAEAGTYVNFPNETLSDISSINQLIPDFALKYFETSFIGFDTSCVKSITSFGLNDTLYIAMDYTNQVNGYDLAIFKVVCEKINKLQMVKSNINDLQESFIYTMNALARAAESKDDITGHHIKRVNDYSSLLAKEIGMDDQFINDIEIAAQMHDVGKISVSELILDKPGKLTNEEFDEMKKHTIYGAEIIGASNNLRMAKTIALSHHEKYDGSGYPNGLKGDDIPIEARIVSLADIYDALRSPRSYKEGFSHEVAYNIITVGDGRVMPEHFDSDVLEAFIRVHEDMRYIYDSTTE